jgi:hypothetical protein
MELLSLGRMAARLGVTQEWLREQAAARKVPALVAGKRFLFNPVAVLDALAIQAARPVKGRADKTTRALVARSLVGAKRIEPMPRADAMAESLASHSSSGGPPETLNNPKRGQRPGLGGALFSHRVNRVLLVSSLCSLCTLCSLCPLCD